MIHFFGHGIQTSDDVSQAFAVGQLGESHDAKVVGAFECLHVGNRRDSGQHKFEIAAKGGDP